MISKWSNNFSNKIKDTNHDLLPVAVALGERLGALAVAPARARREEVGEAARLEEGLLLDLAVAVELLAEDLPRRRRALVARGGRPPRRRRAATAGERGRGARRLPRVAAHEGRAGGRRLVSRCGFSLYFTHVLYFYPMSARRRSAC